AHMWSVITETFAAVNRHELPSTTPDWVNTDNRPLSIIGSGNLLASLSATWELAPDFAIRVEIVHRLTGVGAAFTYVAHGTSQDGVDAEWREIAVALVEGDEISRCERFGEADLHAALTKLAELDQPVPQLANTATQLWARVADAFNRRDLDAGLALHSANG